MSCIGHVTVKYPIYETFRKLFVYIRITFDFNVKKPFFAIEFGFLNVFGKRYKITLSKRWGNILFTLGERLILTFRIPIFAIKF